MKPTRSLRHRRSWVVALLAVLLGAGLSGFGSVPSAAATPTTQTSQVGIQNQAGIQNQYYWGPVSRNCSPSNFSCMVRATGGAGWQYHLRDGVVKSSWKNTTATPRISSHGSGQQTASVTAHTSLSNASAKCECVTLPCPVSAEERA